MVYFGFSLGGLFLILNYLHRIIVFKILQKSQGGENRELLDEICNRKAVLLTMIAVVLCCSPV